MKPIENIFSKTKTSIEPKCPNQNCKIIIDKREKQSLIATNLFSQKANLEFETLEIGDYLIGETIIERKTFSDFVQSMVNKRLQEQLINLKKYEKRILILEGFGYNYEKFKVHQNAIKGMLLSVANDFSTPIIYTKDESDTASFLILLARKYENKKVDYSIRPSKNQTTLNEQKQFVLEGFPGIGPTTAKELLKEFKTLEKIFNSEEDLKKLIGTKSEEFLKVLKE